MEGSLSSENKLSPQNRDQPNIIAMVQNTYNIKNLQYLRSGEPELQLLLIWRIRRLAQEMGVIVRNRKKKAAD